MIKLLAGVLAGSVYAAGCFAAPIADTYIGGTATHSSWAGKDVIGDKANFDIHSMEITQTGSQFQFDIATNFAGKAGNFFGSDIGYGDLFLGSSWTPASDTKNDTFTNTSWSYALVLDDHYGSGGSLTLYQLVGGTTTNGAINDNVLLSQHLMEPTNNIYRENQEVRVNTDSQNLVALATGNWSVGQQSLLLSVDLSGTGLMSTSDLAYHWTMYCANDVIEGQTTITTQVPEPATLGLMGLGLIGLFGFRRRKAA
ncbi:MAG TPA: PEP-CTERM sorting domain-containing protein [Marinobacter sp.]|nr:PEP-CTERM sorting domain-containing protein [Marinobacter sp.]